MPIYRYWSARLVRLFVVLALLSASLAPAQVENRARPLAIGGVTTTGFPYVVSILDNSKPEYSESEKIRAHMCAGVVISTDLVLTAAHCMFAVDVNLPNPYVARTPQQMNVLYGTADLWWPAGRRLAVSRIFVHPEYNAITHDHDLAVIQTSSPMFGMADFVADSRLVMRLSSSRKITLDDPMTLVGWGMTAPNGAPSRMKNRLEMQLVSTAWCQTQYAPFPVKPGMVCAIGHESNRTCRGDSGSALISLSPGRPQLVGLDSWGDNQPDGCTLQGKPTVFTSISGPHLKFIRGAMREANSGFQCPENLDSDSAIC
ncbi:MAG TPA: serine protease [Ramlibacter sp.]|nr:serine protease [Ramlibacter sp.]